MNGDDINYDGSGDDYDDDVHKIDENDPIKHGKKAKIKISKNILKSQDRK